MSELDITESLTPSVFQKVATYETDWVVASFTENISPEEQEILSNRFFIAHTGNVLNDIRATIQRNELDQRGQYFRKIKPRDPYKKRRVGNFVLNLSLPNKISQTILSADRWSSLTPAFDELHSVSHQDAHITIEGMRYVLHGNESLRSEANSKRVPNFLLEQSVTLSREVHALVVRPQNATKRRDIIKLQQTKPAVKSSLFGFDEERTRLQHAGTELFESAGQQILDYAQSQSEQKTIVGKADEALTLPTVTINGKPAAVRLSTGADGVDTISLLSPGYQPTESQAWQELRRLPERKWLKLPSNPRILHELEQTIMHEPGFHMTRHSANLHHAITIVNGTLGNVIDDKHPKFQPALEEIKALLDAYFIELKTAQAPTLYQRRQLLAAQAEQAAREAAFKNRSLAKKILGYFGLISDAP